MDDPERPESERSERGSSEGGLSEFEDLGARLREIPHSAALGMQLVSFDGDHCELMIPYSEYLVGDPDTGVIHGGALTALLDNAAGYVARPSGEQGQEIAIATLDMRIDYMGAATPGRDIVARAHCFKRTRRIAFVRAVAYHDSADDPVATCTAAFMMGTPNTPLSERA